MYTWIIAFLLGTLSLQAQSELPDPRILLLSPLLLALSVKRASRVVAALGLGFLWAMGSAWMDLRHGLPDELEGRDLLLRGVVSGLPETKGRLISFNVDVAELVYHHRSYPSPGRVSLNWYGGAPDLTPGDAWQLKVRLKQPHGFMNPGGFDYEGWLFSRGIRAKGYVVADPQNRNTGEAGLGYTLQRFRYRIRSHLDEQVRDAPARGLLKALVIGDRSELSASDWEIFRKTGTNHLIAISGLHVGIVGGLGFYLAGVAWRRSGWLMRLLATPRAAALAALFCGGVYAGLAGFSLPTQRALVMLCVYMGGFLVMRQTQPVRGFSLALLIVLILDPRAGLEPGFWLSFLAVASILAGVSWRCANRGLLWTWTRAQWLVALGLTPVLLAWQQQVPLIAPLVNLVAVPVFSLVLIPLALGGTLLSLLWAKGTMFIILTLQWLLSAFHTLLSKAASVPLTVSVANQLPAHIWWLAAIGVLLLLLPRGFPSRWLGILMLLPLFVIDPDRAPAAGDFRFDLLDVGQGMAAVIQTHRHILVYDTGPRYSSTFDTGTAVLLPFLRDAGVTHIDKIVVSNGDSDHSGGLQALVHQYPSARVVSGEPQRIELIDAQLCASGAGWQWDGVSFTLLHPGGAGSWSGNDASCVLRVENAAGRLLITGDIESAAEQHLLSCCLEQLHAELVTIPHHGSMTSSQPRFVEAVGARFALSSSGYRNRYGFPRKEVLERWKGAGTRILDTSSSGAIGFLFSRDHGLVGPSEQRVKAASYWTHRTGLGNGASR